MQRRILYGMSEMGLRPDRPHVKSSRVVGEVMGKYHPHGDQAIYDALVRMAQPFTMRLPLVDGHGNFGSLDDGPAASRYTEARMAPAALLMVAGLDEDTVDFVPNYDDSLTQPGVLPAAYPNLLVNGACGIAVGMATNMAPHNLVEVIGAARHLIAHPDCSLDDLMRFVPGPDLPGGGRIIGLDGIREAYLNGRGTFRTRATARVEKLTPRRMGIVVTELPYLDRPGEGHRADQGPGAVQEAAGHQRRQGPHRPQARPAAGLRGQERLQPRCRARAALPAHPDGGLLRHQQRRPGRRPAPHPGPEAAAAASTSTSGSTWCGGARSTGCAGGEERLHLVEGLLVAIIDIDEVIQLIRGSDDTAMAKARLISVFDLSDAQADYILELQLRRLTRFSRIELETERDELLRQIEELEAILADEKLLHRTVSDRARRRRQGARHPPAHRAARVGRHPRLGRDPARGHRRPVLGAAVVDRAAGPHLAAPTRCRRRAAGPSTTPIIGAVRTTARGEFALVTSRGRMLRMSALELPTLPPLSGSPSLSGGAPLAVFVDLPGRGGAADHRAVGRRRAGLALGTASGVVKRVTTDYPGRPDWEVIVAARR